MVYEPTSGVLNRLDKLGLQAYLTNFKEMYSLYDTGAQDETGVFGLMAKSEAGMASYQTNPQSSPVTIEELDSSEGVGSSTPSSAPPTESPASN